MELGAQPAHDDREQRQPAVLYRRHHTVRSP
eukprot:COSAG04_NODE_5952_length_1448_cov_3.232024_1_plen_30_part_10